MSFGDPSRLKILKEITFTIVGGQKSQVILNWGYDYTEGYNKTATIVFSNAQVAEYGISEYNVSTSEYSKSIIIDKIKAKPTGSGTVATIGLEAIIKGASLSIQDLNTEALIGRMI
jgi:hypothetical protein